MGNVGNSQSRASVRESCERRFGKSFSRLPDESGKAAESDFNSESNAARSREPYLKGDQNSIGATSDRESNVAVGTTGIVSTVKAVPNELLSRSLPPEL